MINKNNSYLFILLPLLFLPSLSQGENFSDTLEKPSPQTKVITPSSSKIIIPSPAKQSSVPDLKCKSFSNATLLLKQKAFKIVKERYVLSRACGGRSDNITSQKPQANTMMKSGSTVYVTLTSSPLTASISASSTKVTKGKSLTFKAKINYTNANLIWKLDSRLTREKITHFTVDTRKLSTGTHTVTLEANLNHLGLKPQKRIISKTFTVVAKKFVAPIAITAPAPTSTNPTLDKKNPISQARSTQKTENELARETAKKAEKLRKKREIAKQIELARKQEKERTRQLEAELARKRAEKLQASNEKPSKSTPPPLVPPNSTEDKTTQQSIQIDKTNAVQAEPTIKDPSPIGELIQDGLAQSDKHYGEILYNPPTEMIKTQRLCTKVHRLLQD